MNFDKIVIAGFLLITSLGCIDEIKLKIDTDQKQLAVDGLIADSLDIYKISVHNSAIIGVGNDNVLEPVTGASVVVYDELGASFEFIESELGVYAQLMKGEIGHSYFVEIVLPTGQTIRSAPVKMLPAPKIEKISTEVTEESSLNSAGNLVTDTRLIVKVDTRFDDFIEKPFLRWRAEGIYEFKERNPVSLNFKTCYVENKVDLNNLRIFDTRALGGDRIFDEPFLNTVLDYRFAFQYCFHISQYAMSETEYEYWKAVQDIITIDGSLFDPPPGTVRGNLFDADDPSNIVVGYFSVAGVSTKRYFANPQSLRQTYIEPKCVNSRFRPVTSDCIDCTSISGSTLERPVYWEP